MLHHNLKQIITELIADVSKEYPNHELKTKNYWCYFMLLSIAFQAIGCSGITVQIVD